MTMTKLSNFPFRYFISKSFNYNLNKIKALSFQLESLKNFKAFNFTGIFSENFLLNKFKLSKEKSNSKLIENLKMEINEKETATETLKEKDNSINDDVSIMKITTHKRKKIKMKKQKFWKRRRVLKNKTKKI